MKISFETRSGVFDVDATAGESVLFSGLSAGLTLPYECATGTCGTCRGRVMSGAVEVAWDAAPGHAKLKRDKGDILMCQSRPTGDCVVRVATDVARVSGAARPARHSAVIERLRPLTHDVVEFDVRVDRPIRFDAGQFAVLSVPGMAGGRAYSMVNYEPETDRLVFVVKKKPGGGFSEWIFDPGRVGGRIELFGTLGRATFRPEEAKDLVIVAGGSGIAGMMAILDCAVRAGHFARYRGRMFFGVRTLADGFYLEELSRLVAASGGNLAVSLVLSHETPAGSTHPAYPSIGLDTGFVHEAAGRAMPEGGGEQAIGFVAGPPPMVDGAIRVLLRQARVPATSIRYDKFG